MNKPGAFNHYYEFDFWSPNWDKIHKFPGKEVGINRYQALLPVKITVSLGEGDTPLLKASDSLLKHFGLENLWIKHEEMNPTGCFKDRESSVVISAAKQKGITSVVVASSGNAALSTAAYCKIAGIRCTAFIPNKTEISKKDLIRLYGAGVKTLPGVYENVYRYVADMKTKDWNVTSGQNSLRTEGNKTIAYEIWEQVGVSDVIVVPAGNGGCLAGIWKGFWDLKRIGKIDKIPKMIAVQIKNAAPLEKALELGKEVAIVKDAPDSIAEGIVAEESYCSPKAIFAIKDSGGKVVTVSDQEIVDALVVISKYESFIAEPTSAAAFAALSKLKELKSQFIVVVNTGNGMKMLGKVVKLINNRKLLQSDRVI
jgi:threonine synthase